MATGCGAMRDPLHRLGLGDHKHVQREVYPAVYAREMRSSLDGWENTVSAMNGARASISASRVSAATRAAS